MKALWFALVASTLITGCGGGSGDSAPPSNTPTPVKPPVQNTNSAPRLTVSPTKLEMAENTSFEILLSYSDLDGDAVTVTAETSEDFLTPLISGNTLTLTAGEVDVAQTATITIKASDGKTTTTQGVSVSVTNLTSPEPNSAPVITMATTSVEMRAGSTSIVHFSVEDAEGHSIDWHNLILSHDPHLEVVRNGTSSFAISANGGTGTYPVTWSVADALGAMSQTATFDVIVANAAVNTGAPTLDWSDGFSGIRQVKLKNNQTVEYPFSISDPDGDQGQFECLIVDTWVDQTNPIDASEYDVEFNCEQRRLTLKANDLIAADAEIQLVLAVKDGELRSELHYVLVEFENLNVDIPIINFIENVNPIEVLPNQVVHLHYEIIGDERNLAFSDISTNPQSDGCEYFTAEHNAGDKSFTITMATDNYLISCEAAVNFKLGKRTTSARLLVSTIANPDLDINAEALKYIRRNTLSLYQLREYQLIGKLYSEILFGKGLISAETRNQYDSKFHKNSRDAAGQLIAIANEMYEQMAGGQYIDDPSLLAKQKSRFASYADHFTKADQEIIDEVNELADMDASLPTIVYSSNWFFLDAAETATSRLIGNTTYGAYVDRLWVYDQEYQIFKALLGKTKTGAFVK